MFRAAWPRKTSTSSSPNRPIMQALTRFQAAMNETPEDKRTPTPSQPAWVDALDDPPCSMLFGLKMDDPTFVQRPKSPSESSASEASTSSSKGDSSSTAPTPALPPTTSS